MRTEELRTAAENHISNCGNLRELLTDCRFNRTASSNILRRVAVGVVDSFYNFLLRLGTLFGGLTYKSRQISPDGVVAILTLLHLVYRVAHFSGRATTSALQPRIATAVTHTNTKLFIDLSLPKKVGEKGQLIDTALTLHSP